MCIYVHICICINIYIYIYDLHAQPGVARLEHQDALGVRVDPAGFGAAFSCRVLHLRVAVDIADAQDLGSAFQDPIGCVCVCVFKCICVYVCVYIYIYILCHYHC